jgi:hypothetical protein
VVGEAGDGMRLEMEYEKVRLMYGNVVGWSGSGDGDGTLRCS